MENTERHSQSTQQQETNCADLTDLEEAEDKLISLLEITKQTCDAVQTACVDPKSDMLEIQTQQEQTQKELDRLAASYAIHIRDIGHLLHDAIDSIDTTFQASILEQNEQLVAIDRHIRHLEQSKGIQG